MRQTLTLFELILVLLVVGGVAAAVAGDHPQVGRLVEVPDAKRLFS